MPPADAAAEHSTADHRALLLTDVVDSTALSSRLGDAAMAGLWAQHDRAARDLLPRWRGREIDKSDGLLLLFDDMADAAGYALDYHRALAALPVPLRSRAGLHWGPVILRENPPDDVARGAKPLEVDGLAKPLAARVMALARGGQTLLTAEALAALAPALDDGDLHTADHGHWQLKGVEHPVAVHEVGTDPAAFATPADGDKGWRVAEVAGRWLPVREIPNNLPEPPNAFVGRERELAEVKARVLDGRLLTLLGMGGLGKTRLSLQVGAELLARFPDGVWFIDFAPLRDGRLVVAEAAQVLGVREEPGRTLQQALVEHLKPQRTLLILDNCEHLLQPIAALAHAVLRAAPGVAMLASSREGLRVPGERLYPILPLPVPKASDGVAALERSTAVRLFIDRARDHRPDFELTDELAPHVAELVARLEGIPLALELAAARLRSLALPDINRRLKNRFKLLTGGARVRDDRQVTLRGLIDWSYDLLDDDDRRVLQRLAVFSGGFDLAAAEAVCADPDGGDDGDGLEADDVLDRLDSLTQKSLLTLDASRTDSRWNMLETIRDYAAEKLADSGEADAVGSRHVAHFFEFAKQGRNGMRGPKQGQWLDRLEGDEDNLRAAMARAQAADDPDEALVAVKLAVALQNFWIMRGRCTEGRAAIAALLNLPAVLANDMFRGHALYVGATLAAAQGDLVQALALLDVCLQLRRALGHQGEVAATLSTQAFTLLASGDAQAARSSAVESLDLMRRSGNAVGEAIVNVMLGQILAALGRLPEADEALRLGLQQARQLHHPETEGEAELVLAGLAFDAGDIAQAEAGAHRSLGICRAAGDRRGAARALAVLARLDLLAGRHGRSAERLDEALAVFDSFGLREPWLACLDDEVALLFELGDQVAATALGAAAQRLRADARLVRSAAAEARWSRVAAALQAALGDAAHDAAWRAGQGYGLAETQLRAREALAAHAVPEPSAL